MSMSSLEGFNRARPPSGLEKFPILPEFFLMKLGPRLDESPLLLRDGSRNELNWVDPKHRNPILVVRMEVRGLVGSASLCKHPDNDPEEARDLGHTSILSFPAMTILRGLPPASQGHSPRKSHDVQPRPPAANPDPKFPLRPNALRPPAQPPARREGSPAPREEAERVTENG